MMDPILPTYSPSWDVAVFDSARTAGLSVEKACAYVRYVDMKLSRGALPIPPRVAAVEHREAKSGGEP